MRFQAGSGIDMFIKSSNGNVGIQTTVPVHPLHVQDGDLGIVTNSADAVAKSTIFTKSRNNTDGAHTVVEDNDILGNIKFQGSNGASFVDGASIFARVNGNPASAASISSISVAGAGYTATGGGSASATSAATGVGSGLTVSITVGGSGEITGATVVGTGKRYVTGDTVTVTGGSSAATLVVTADTSDMPSELVFATSTDSGGTPLEHIVITNSGKVGIGDPYPSVKLHVNVNSSNACGAFYNTSTSGLGSGTSGSQAAVFDNKVGPTIKLTNSTHEDSDGGRECGIAFQGEQSGGEISTLGLMQFSHDGVGDDEKGKLTISVNDGDDGHVPSVTAMTILSAGNVGIGATGVVHKLHVQDGDLGIVTNSADDVAQSLVFTKSKNATDGAHTAVDDDTVLGNIVFEGSDSTGAFEPGAKIRAQIVAGTIGDGRIPTELIFSTAPDSASAPLDALVVSPSGFVEVHSPTNGARLLLMDSTVERAGFKAFSGGLYVDTADSAHDIFFRPGGSTTALCIDAGNTFVGILDVTPTKALDVKNGESGGDILCYDIYTHDGGVTSSDERMKENIVETTLGLDFINTLNPVSYKWKDTDEYTEMRTVPGTDGEPEHEEVANTFGAVQYTRTHHGLIAQQVNQAVTDAGLTATEFAGYTYDPETDQHGLRYQEFIAPLIKAVQELTARVAELEGN